MKKIAVLIFTGFVFFSLVVSAQPPAPTTKAAKPPKLKGVDKQGRQQIDDTFKEHKAKKFRNHHRRWRRHNRK
jgi:hypothetical protein